MRILLLSFLMLLFTPILHAQELARRGSLGAQMQTSETHQGIDVIRVIEKTTASALGLEAEDVILKVNGIAYTEVGDLVDAIGHWRAKDPVVMEILRAEKELILKGKIQGQPLETSSHGSILYGHVDFDGGKMRSMLSLPTEIEKPPVIFFLPGIGCGTLEHALDPEHPIKQFTEGLVENGYAVYRVDKPGMGDSFGGKHCLEYDYEHEVAAYEAALKKLQSLSEIDAGKIILYGHSLGAMTAPIIGAKHPVKGIICWGGVSTSWYEYELDRLREQKIKLGIDYESIENVYRVRQPFYYDFFVNKLSPTELRAKEGYAEIANAVFPNNSDLYYGLHHYSFAHDLNDPDLTAAWKATNCPVLALHGEYDLAAINEEWAINVANIVNYYNPGLGSYEIIPRTVHHYSMMPSWEDYLEMRSNGSINAAYHAENFNHDVVKIISNWIGKILIA